ncbi:hypothetical protein FRC09_020846 [Ceratobasidium sp. 395]|nr:hypothetical protein FRC09_020846 [Ceratobasidium sp. 395]
MDEAAGPDGLYVRKRSSSRLSSAGNLAFTSLHHSSGNLQSLQYPRRDSDTIGQKSPMSSPPRSRRSSRAPSPVGRLPPPIRPSASPVHNHNQRRSCPPSPSASFASLASVSALSPRLTQRPTYQRTRSRSNTTSPVAVASPQFAPTPGAAPICIRSRSSSHPHLPTYGSPAPSFARTDRRNSREALAAAASPVQTPYNNFTTGHNSLTGASPFPRVSSSTSAGPSSPTAPFFSSAAAPGYLSIGPRRMDVDDSDGEQDLIVMERRIHHGSGSIGRIRSRTHVGRGNVTETETEREGPPRVLPTARGPMHHQPSATPLMTRLIPLLMLSFRLLAIVPAAIGTVIHVHHVVHPPEGTRHTRIDFGVAACWSVLTGFQCWFLTCGLLQRWIAYYPLLSTLVRLLALQAICWPATHITLSVLDHDKRPAACWAVVGTTTCVSRAIQLWATSNLGPIERGQRVIYGRKWDWGDVALKCALPCALVYFVMAWGAVFNRELGLC